MSEQDVTLSLVHAVAGHHLANLQISRETEIQKLYLQTLRFDLWRKKIGPGLFRGCKRDEILPSFVGIIS